LRKSGLLQDVICRLDMDASCFINLHQVCGYQVLTSLMEQLAARLMNASMLMQVEKIRLAASCSNNLQQACG
jgi:hypothetical protein